MDANEIKELLRRDPLEPFRFHLTSGATFDIHEPSLVALGQRRVFVAFTDEARQAFFPYLHLAAVEALKNGRRPRRK